MVRSKSDGELIANSGPSEARSHAPFSTPPPPRQLSRNSQGAGLRRASTLPPSGFSQDPLVPAPTIPEDSWEALPSHRTIAHQRFRSRTRPRRQIHHPVTERFKCRPSSILRRLQVNFSRLVFPTRRILKPWTSPPRHILTRPSLRLCLMLIPHPGCCSHLMSRMASTRPSYTTTRPGLMPCIPIGLFDSHVFPFLSVFFLSFLFPPFLVLYSIGSRLSNVWKGDIMPLCIPSHELYSVHTMFLWLLCQSCAIHPHISNVDHLFTTYALALGFRWDHTRLAFVTRIYARRGWHLISWALCTLSPLLFSIKAEWTVLRTLRTFMAGQKSERDRVLQYC